MAMKQRAPRDRLFLLPSRFVSPPPPPPKDSPGGGRAGGCSWPIPPPPPQKVNKYIHPITLRHTASALQLNF